MAETIRGGAGALKPESPARPPETGQKIADPPVVRPYAVRALAKGETVITPYGSVLVGMNSVVVSMGGKNIPMPLPFAETLFGYKQGG